MTLLTDSLRSVVSAGAGLKILLGLALNAFVVVPLAVCVSLLLRKSAASARHLVWLLAVIATVAAPAMSLVVPDSGWSPFRVDLSTMIATAAPTGNAGNLTHIGFADRASEFPTRPEVLQRPVMDHRIVVVKEVVPQTPPESSVDGIPALPIAVVETVSLWTLADLQQWSILGFVCWAGGAAVVLVLAIVGRLFLWRRRSSFCEVTDLQMLWLFDSVRAELALRRSVTLLESETDSMPMTWGIVRPVLLLPVSARCWSEERLRMIFLHELAHVKRFDCLWQVVSVVAMACHWFNPLVWLAVLRLRSECEQACDDVVIAVGVPAADYGAQLLDISTGGRRNVLALCAGLALARPHRLTGRLEAIVDQLRRRDRLSRRAIGVSAIAAALIVVSLSLVAHVTVDAADPQQAEQSVAERSKQGNSQETKPGENDDQAQDLRFLNVGRRRLRSIQFPFREFTFARIRYSSYSSNRRLSGRWATDYPDADTAFSKRLAEWTSLKVNPDEVVKTLSDDDLGEYPFLYMCEPGSLLLSDDEVTSLRSYLAAGGFLMVDDFWGEAEWDNFYFLAPNAYSLS
ncbi:MAG TPA: DUF4159 domain-containing protein, partial [Fuerstia sp.]|nr:DUF4159 domain-containing protein [Fuerstiella sp.]